MNQKCSNLFSILYVFYIFAYSNLIVKNKKLKQKTNSWNSRAAIIIAKNGSLVHCMKSFDNVTSVLNNAC